MMPQYIDKAYSLGILLDALKTDRTHMICCGDGFNDISMISYAEIGVAMTNGSEKTKASADCIAPSNDDDGIAAVIDCLLENTVKL